MKPVLKEDCTSVSATSEHENTKANTTFATVRTGSRTRTEPGLKWNFIRARPGPNQVEKRLKPMSLYSQKVTSEPQNHSQLEPRIRTEPGLKQDCIFVSTTSAHQSTKQNTIFSPIRTTQQKPGLELSQDYARTKPGLKQDFIRTEPSSYSVQYQLSHNFWRQDQD